MTKRAARHGFPPRSKVDIRALSLYKVKDDPPRLSERRSSMKKPVLLLTALAVLTVPAFSGVVKKSRSEVTFKGFGKLTMTQSSRLVPERQWVDSQNEFKGKGLLGGLAGKTLLRSGSFGEITDLPALTVTRLDPKKKEYTVTPIKKFEAEKAEEGAAGEKTGKPAESDIRIIKSEFRVDDTGEAMDVNGFPTMKYVVIWTVDWENVRTGEKGTNKLETDVRTTPLTDAIVKAQEEEAKYFRGYMKAVGLDQEKLQQDVLGTNWMTLLDSMNAAKGRPGASLDASKTVAEMKKIKGYPVVIDGKYTVTSDKPKGDAQEEGGSKGLLGGLAKKVLKKKPAGEGPAEPTLAYRVEILELAPADLGEADFQAPPDYRKKG
jgi:hypothetical protein